MTRGNQRDKDRARAEARKVKAGGAAKKGKKDDKAAAGPKLSDAEKLQAKIAAKQKLKEEGKVEEKPKDRGEKYVAKSRVESMVNPHTGKRDPEYTKKMLSKSKP
mmetsp:Transcript_2725/g.4253  ORF Transcript_2725/g.4253 Transcript_2725/m.4253 type:complete len:105 (-) Transcript_2725:932-1246(-)|eukprot:CAMPEP_0171503362 /NCGR_PEP_ID=MMETSP0958-20121227/10829_1 /TAXON_ID=87120 /ORGANISM="Aurantiochytrium limacinum, Strain ATCCMYA-1381" /LENGTH=104 /DNA_ID=CAMNT_0012038795 /DNA_START=19 /DNA_END=333 /DNA_ORIENTATION=+